MSTLNSLVRRCHELRLISLLSSCRTSSGKRRIEDTLNRLSSEDILSGKPKVLDKAKYTWTSRAAYLLARKLAYGSFPLIVTLQGFYQGVACEGISFSYLLFVLSGDQQNETSFPFNPFHYLNFLHGSYRLKTLLRIHSSREPLKYTSAGTCTL